MADRRALGRHGKSFVVHGLCEGLDELVLVQDVRVIFGDRHVSVSFQAVGWQRDSQVWLHGMDISIEETQVQRVGANSKPQGNIHRGI